MKTLRKVSKYFTQYTKFGVERKPISVNDIHKGGIACV